MSIRLTHPLRVSISVQYRRDVPEHYQLTIAPHAAGRVRVQLRSQTFGAISDQVLPWSSTDHHGLPARVMHAVVAGFFGTERPAPRIVGAFDWSHVELDVLALTRTEQPERLLSVLLDADEIGCATLAVANGSFSRRSEVIKLLREDADPIYAVTRLVLRSLIAEEAAAESAMSHMPEAPQRLRVIPTMAGGASAVA
jgi:hypothetical protein